MSSELHKRFIGISERWLKMNHCLFCIDVYTVNEGDTLYSIAEKYDLPVSLLMKVNDIDNPYNLKIGTRLCIPGTEEQLPQAPEQCQKTHTVKAGDTLYLIAKMHNIKLDALMLQIQAFSYGVKYWEEDLPTTLYNTLSICFLVLEPLVGGKYSWCFRF